MNIHYNKSVDLPSDNQGSSNSTDENSLYKVKNYNRKHMKSTDDNAMFYSRSHAARKRPKESPITCEQIVEVEDDMFDDENKHERRRRWFHPKMLFDAEDQQLGLNMKNVQFNVGFKTDGRSKSSDLIRMPKIVETAVEDDVNVFPLSHWQNHKSSYSNKFINRVDNVENQLMKPHNSSEFNIKWPKLNSNPHSAYRGQQNELTIEEKSDEGKANSSDSDEGMSLSIKAMSGSNNYEVSSRKSRKRKDSASGKSIHSPSNRSQKKIVLVDEAESLTDSKIFPKSRQEAFVVIEEDPKEEAELDQNEELAEQFKEKHAKLKKDAGKQVIFLINFRLWI